MVCVCRLQAFPPLKWSPPLRPFHVKGIKGCTRWLKVVPFTLVIGVISPHFITIGDRGPHLVLFLTNPGISQGRGLGFLPMSRCDVIIPPKNNLQIYIYIYITYPIDIKNDGHLKGISFQIWLSMLSWVSMLNFRYPTVIILSPSIPLWKKHFCWWNISF